MEPPVDDTLADGGAGRLPSPATMPSKRDRYNRLMVYQPDYILWFINITLTLAALFLILRSGRRVYRGSKNNLDLPRCANCRYALVNSPTNICSECGADIPTAGVIPPGKRGLPDFKAFVAWTILCIAPLFFAPIILPYSLVRLTAESEIRFVSTNPIVTQFDKVTVLAKGNKLALVKSDRVESVFVPVESATLVVHIAGVGKIDFDADGKNFRVTGDPAPHPFTESEIRARLFAAVGNPADTYSNHEARELAAIFSEAFKLSDIKFISSLESSPNAAHWMNTGSTSTQTLTTWPSFELLYPLILVLWTSGVLKLLPRKQNILRGKAAIQLIAAS